MDRHHAILQALTVVPSASRKLH